MKTFKFVFLLLFLGGAQVVFAQTPEQRKEIIKNNNQEELIRLAKQFDEEFKKGKEEALEYARLHNIPVTFVDSEGNSNELMYIAEGKYPIYYVTHNAGSAITARVNHINTGGSEGLDLNGQDMIVGVFEIGPIRSSHQDLTGRVIHKDFENFISSNDNTQHATHVAGTIAGSGSGNSSAKGLAYEATIWGNTSNSDVSKATSQAAEGLLVSNHSYGLRIDLVPSWYKGAYIQESRNWDQLMNNAPYYQAVISAGNDRGKPEDTKGGRDLLLGNKNSKNAVVVAAVHNVSNYTGPGSVTMSSFSSWGPTDDYRIKPDISAKGVGVLSLGSSSNSHYYSSQGTSMSAPAVSACLILMQQHYNNTFSGFMRAATLKGLMTNSADEAGFNDGPDYQYGWGLINAQKAIQIINKKATQESIIDELVLAQGETYTRNILVNGTEPLRATLTWTDSPGQLSSGVEDDDTSVLVNDLDIRITKDGETFYPWVLNPFFIQGGAIQDDNPYDNVETIDIYNPQQGTYTITISHKGSLQGGSQAFSLVVSGMTDTASADEFDLSGVSMYPNPTNGLLTISGIDLGAAAIVEVYDVQGRKVREVRQMPGYDRVNVDLSDLSKSMYMVKLVQGKGVFTDKVFVK